jgi:hypothetical protein
VSSFRELPYLLRMRSIDAKTRGIYIELACNVERLMDDIIGKCEVLEPLLRSGFRKNKIMHLQMGKKLSRCVKSLKAYNENYYNQYSKEFESINDLVTYRNVLAHGYSQYDENGVDERFIKYYNKEKGRIAEYKIEPMEFIKNLLEFDQVVLKLVELIQTLIRERGVDYYFPV